MSETIHHKITLAQAVARVHAEPVPYALLFERGDMALELFIPRGGFTQPGVHEHDELYLVISGAAILLMNDERIPCSTGDVLYVPAFTDHRFEAHSQDFRTWVIFVRSRG